MRKDGDDPALARFAPSGWAMEATEGEALFEVEDGADPPTPEGLMSGDVTPLDFATTP